MLSLVESPIYQSPKDELLPDASESLPPDGELELAGLVDTDPRETAADALQSRRDDPEDLAVQLNLRLLWGGLNTVHCLWCCLYCNYSCSIIYLRIY